MKNIRIRDLGLTAWIALSMLLGFIVSQLFPHAVIVLEKLSFHGTNVPLAIVMIAMLYPTFAKVPIEKVGLALNQPKILGLSLILNWVIGPVLMFVCAITFLHAYPDYLVGLILVGIARCIAMVVLWNNLAGGDEVTCAALVAFNSLFQCLTYALYAYFFLWVVLPWFGIHVVSAHIAFTTILGSVGLYLGVPFVAGILTQLLRLGGRDEWYQQTLMPKVAPVGLYALLATIALLFMFNGTSLMHHIDYTLLIALPLVLYFSLMFVISVFMGLMADVGREKNIALALTAASNNFELAIAVAIATFGVHSEVAFASIIGPLIEVPVMLVLIKLTSFIR